MRRQTLSVLVVVLVAVAGCSAGPFGTDTSPSTETVTPVPVHPTATATATPTTPFSATAVPTGIHPNGSVNLTRVALSHNRYLSNRTFTLRYGEFQRLPTADADVSTVNRSVRIRVENDTNYLVTYLNETGTVEREYYGDESGQYRRTLDNGTTHTAVLTTVPTPVHWRFSSSTFGLGSGPLVLSADEASVTTVERGGEALYRIHVPSTPDGTGQVDRSNYTATLYVTDDGLIRTMYVEYETGDGDDVDPRRVRTRYSFAAVGETTVDRPAWADEVRGNGSDARRTETRTDGGRRTGTD